MRQLLPIVAICLGVTSAVTLRPHVTLTSPTSLLLTIPGWVEEAEAELEVRYSADRVLHSSHVLATDSDGRLSVMVPLDHVDDSIEVGVVIGYRVHGQPFTSTHRQSFTLKNSFPLEPASSMRRRATVVLWDDFSSGKLDTSRWTPDVTAYAMHDSFQMFTPDPRNIYVKNGVLHLRPTLTSDKFGDNFLHSGTLDMAKIWGTCTTNYMNGCLRHGGKMGPNIGIAPVMASLVTSVAQVSHGRVEVVAKLCKGDWLWPAIWLYANQGKYGVGWPLNGEIDLMEARGNVNWKTQSGVDLGIQRFGSNLHYGPDPNQDRPYPHDYMAPHGTWGDGFHTYWVDYNVDHIHVGVDNHTVLAMQTPAQGYWQYGHFHGNNIWQHGGHDAPFDAKTNLILNVVVGGGGYWSDNSVNQPYPKPWKNHAETAMQDFYNARHQWYATWHGDDSALQITSVKMVQY